MNNPFYKGNKSKKREKAAPGARSTHEQREKKP